MEPDVVMYPQLTKVWPDVVDQIELGERVARHLALAKAREQLGGQTRTMRYRRGWSAHG